MRDELIRRHLAACDGVISMAEARARGLDRHAVRRRVDRGEWITEARGIYRAADHPRTRACTSASRSPRCEVRF